MTARLLLDEHYAEDIAAALRELGHDVLAVVADPELRGTSDPAVFQNAAEAGRRVVTENIKDFRPLLTRAIAADSPRAALLLVPPRRFPRGRGDRTATIVAALRTWLDRPDAQQRPAKDWLIPGASGPTSWAWEPLTANGGRRRQVFKPTLRIARAHKSKYGQARAHWPEK